MLSQERVMEILKEAGVLLEGHFKLTSGKHSNKYLQCAKIFRNTKYSEELCAALAEEFKDDGVEVVIGPALGAVQMTYEVSRWLKCENFFAERDDGVMTLRRGFEIKPGQKVLVVEDVVTTGGSVREVLKIVQEAGGDVVGKEKEEKNEKLEREKKMQKAMLDIKKKYGKNAILKGMNLQEDGTAMERNRQIGGHKA